jgi:hypothetical protein
MKQIRYHAASMELAAYLDGRYVEMHIRTDTGLNIEVVCPRDSIFAIQRHIEQMRRECPEISTWKTGMRADRLHADDQRSYEAAISEGWPVLPQSVRPPSSAGAIHEIR